MNRIPSDIRDSFRFLSAKRVIIKENSEPLNIVDGGFDMAVHHLLDELTKKLGEILKSNLIGVYLHGSLAMGCYNPRTSDVDLLIAVKTSLAEEQKKVIIHVILWLEEQFPCHAMEMSVITNQQLADFEYPMPFDLHYSKAHKDKYLRDGNYLCHNAKDPDLAAHITVTRERGVTLYGQSIKNVFPQIDKAYFLQSILVDIKDAEEQIVVKPVYCTLNLCRILLYLKNGTIASKKEGGEWGLSALPSTYHDWIAYCLEDYVGAASTLPADTETAKNFAAYVLQEIRRTLHGQSIYFSAL